MPLLRSLPEAATLLDLRYTYPEPLERLRPFAQALMRGPSPLTPMERELLAAYVSGLNACQYCVGVHREVARSFGLDEALFEAIMTDLEVAAIDPRLRPLLRYAEKLTRTPARMAAADAAAVYDAGWDDTALFHAIAVCAYFNLMNRLVDGSGIIGTDADRRAAAARVAATGYTSGAEPA